MTGVPDRHIPAEVARQYLTISEDSRYGHFVRIPDRICRCVDYFHVTCSRVAVRERLHSYYLFIGVVDDLIDSSRTEAGREILNQLANRVPSFDQRTTHSRASLVTEILKCHIEPEIYSTALIELEQLYAAVVRERKSTTITSYIEERKVVGRLTAKLSYLLMRPLFEGDREDLRHFLEDVGEVGCLIDSVIDLRPDARLGLLSFSPTLKDYFRIANITLRQAISVTLKHPRLFGLFLEAVGDNVLDRLRPMIPGRKQSKAMRHFEARSDASRTTAKALSGVAWTKP